jgi:hypothetical protein
MTPELNQNQRVQLSVVTGAKQFVLTDELMSLAHCSRLRCAIHGNVEGLHISLSQPYLVDESDLSEALQVGSVDSLAEIALLYAERGVKTSKAVVRALVCRWIDTVARGIDFPGQELLVMLDIDLSEPPGWIRSIFTEAFRNAPLPLQIQLSAHSPMFAFES